MKRPLIGKGSECLIDMMEDEAKLFEEEYLNEKINTIIAN